jgi:hypothetical protein
MLLIGSKALKHWTCGGDPRVCLDTDYICTHDEAHRYASEHEFDRVLPSTTGDSVACFKGRDVTELMFAWPGSTNEEILQLEDGVASLDMLLLLKMSHRYLKNSPHFEKTHRDIGELRMRGAIIKWPDLLKRREKETYNYPHPSLMRNKKGFFDPNEGVQYVYDHDTIHLAMALDPGIPAYTKFKGEAEVMVDRSKWQPLPDDVKLASVIEESLVLALERSQVPFRGKIAPEKSFKMALQKVCTSITSGWWREWAWEHYWEALDSYPKDYLSRFDEAVKVGIVRPFSAA